MSTKQAHMLRYTRRAGEDGATPRDLFLLVSDTEVTLAAEESAVQLLFEGGWEPTTVFWLPMERNILLPLSKRTDGWYTADGITVVLTRNGGRHAHQHPASDTATGAPGADPGA